MAATSTSPTAPSRAAASEPAAFAATTASAARRRCSIAAIIAPAKASPAPVRSRTWTGRTPSATSVIPSSVRDQRAGRAALHHQRRAPRRRGRHGLPDGARAGQPQQFVLVRDEDVGQPDALDDRVAVLLSSPSDTSSTTLAPSSRAVAQEVRHPAPGVQVAPAGPVAAQHAAPAVDLRPLAVRPRRHVRDEGPVAVEVQHGRDPGGLAGYPHRRGQVDAGPGAVLDHHVRAEVIGQDRAQASPGARARGRAGAGRRRRRRKSRSHQ